jgi:hypothetical protein
MMKRREVQSLRVGGRSIQTRLDRVNQLLRWLGLTEQAKVMRDRLRKAEQTVSELARIIQAGSNKRPGSNQGNTWRHRPSGFLAESP